MHDVGSAAGDKAAARRRFLDLRAALPLSEIRHARTAVRVHVLQAQAAAGWRRVAGYVPLRLPFGLKDLFETWLIQHFPDRKDKVLNRIRSLRGGKLNDSSFHTRMQGQGPFADQIAIMFKLACRKAGMNEERLTLSTAAFRPHGAQSLFD